MNKAAEIVDVIERAIVSGDLAPGTVLRQDQLSEELGVSRTPVREALQQLAALELVTLEPNRGARVRMPSREEVTERWQIRAALEALAGELAIARITRAEVKELRATARQAAKLTAAIATADNDRDLRWLNKEWNAANTNFHYLVLDAADAPVLKRTTQSILNIVHGPLMWMPTARLLEYARHADEQHKEIVAAFAAKEIEVRELLRQHILDSLPLVLEALFESASLQPGRLLPLTAMTEPA